MTGSWLAAALLGLSLPCLGAAHIWIGPSGGVWSYSGNWVGGVPATGEGGGTVLLFTSNSNSEDNIAGLVVDQLALSGSNITITGSAGTTLGISTAVATTQISVGGTGDVIASSLTLAFSGTAQKPIAIDATNGSLTLACDLTGSAGEVHLKGPLTLTGTNDYTGKTLVIAGLVTLNSTSFDGAIPGNLVIGDPNAPVGSNPIVREASNSNIANTARVQVVAEGVFDLHGFIERVYDLEDASIGTPGQVTLGSGGWLQLEANGGFSHTFSGDIVGSGSLTKYGNDFQALEGNCTFSGSTNVVSGTLSADGSLNGGTIHVQTGAILSGTGAMGSLDVASGGKVDVGNSNYSAGISTAGVSTFASGSTLDVFIGGPGAGSGYDRLTVNGNVALGGATLNAFLYMYTPPVGTAFKILTFTGTLSGTFAGLPNGSTFTISGKTFRIDYSNADKAVTLTACTTLTSVSVSPSTPASLSCPGAGSALSVSDTGGGSVTHQWGYRVAPGGAVTPIGGQTGTSYTPNTAHFPPGSGTYYVVCTTSPFCGAPTVSNEVTLTITADPTPPTVSAPAAATVTQTTCS